MVRDGWTLAQAAEALGMDVEGCELALKAEQKVSVSVEEIIEKGKISAAKVLVDIIEDPSAENKDRIAACKIVLTGDGKLPEMNANAWDERMKRAKIAQGLAVIDVNPLGLSTC